MRTITDCVAEKESFLCSSLSLRYYQNAQLATVSRLLDGTQMQVEHSGLTLREPLEGKEDGPGSVGKCEYCR